MQVYLVNNYLHRLYEGKEFAEQEYDCSTKEFTTVVETLKSITQVSECSSLNFLHYIPPLNGKSIHSVQVNAKVRLLFEEDKKDEITIMGIQ